MLSQVKLIAEPWDVGPGGYQVGNFPVLWSEWNGIYRDVDARLLARRRRSVGEFASRLTGSSDLYEDDGRHPFASINFITAHDGFTLRDLVSYNEKHNEANREDNRDGTDDNRSWNCGVEGATDDPEINALRARQQRNFLATLLLSQGVPMLLGGDEIGRTQGGNNNAWCQDNEISWFDWDAATSDAGELLEFTQRLIALRRDAPGVPPPPVPRAATRAGGLGPARRLVVPPRRPADDPARLGARRRASLGVFLNGEEIAAPRRRRASAIDDDSFLLLFNAHHEDVDVHAARPRASARAGRSSCRTDDPDAEPDASSVGARERARRSPRARWSLLRAPR